MPFIRTSKPDKISLYLTHPLPESIIEHLKTDFALAAHDKYNPLSKLVVCTRTDLYGCSCEDIARRLEEENMDNIDPKPVLPFLVADDQTGEEGNIVYVDRWADREEFPVGTETLVEPEGSDWPEEGELPFLLKYRQFIWESPITWANYDVGNMTSLEDIFAKWESEPYNPFALKPPAPCKVDWRKQSPNVAYVCASPRSYELKDNDRKSGIMLLGGSQPEKLVRLTHEAADQLGLEPSWTVGWSSNGNNLPEGSMDFAQNWKLKG